MADMMDLLNEGQFYLKLLIKLTADHLMEKEKTDGKRKHVFEQTQLATEPSPRFFPGLSHFLNSQVVEKNVCYIFAICWTHV